MGGGVRTIPSELNMKQRYVCKVYRDDAKGKGWPTDFVRCPEKGELVRTMDGMMTMKVVEIFHCMGRDREGHEYPYVEVELGLWQ